MNESTTTNDRHDESGATRKEAEHQTGRFYCSGCGRRLRTTHEGRSICLTRGCKFRTSGSYRDDYDG